MRSIGLPDIVKGIRAQVIDKDRQPRWMPSTLAQVSAEDVEGYFQPLSTDLAFDLAQRLTKRSAALTG